MSEREPEKPYIYQPYGIQDRPNWNCGRIYGVAGVHLLTTINGLTKNEAQKVLAALRTDAILEEPK